MRQMVISSLLLAVVGLAFASKGGGGEKGSAEHGAIFLCAVRGVTALMLRMLGCVNRNKNPTNRNESFPIPVESEARRPY